MTRKKLLNPNAAKAIEEFNEEMGTEIGTEIGTEMHVDISKDDGFIYVHSGNSVSRAVVEEAERQKTNKK
ncbi:hypothetical protein [Clostridium formicaceticum]|uniref:Small, acid-soluble spore protein, alpha/beta type n=1 Tax=Clostridium formicaceticum TaxID=1497 RepID=A0AAC9RLL2_9CLOT|nr:hypothetical protein [Clostridium formicaceticum]AOY76797.1 hypothetical protein BJL90_13605 [Clostridium formicaceticum]ARE87263.1 hypothetical protein CLFO_16620 [Clostridium formicaceticum]